MPDNAWNLDVMAEEFFDNSRAHGFWEDFELTCLVLAAVRPDESGPVLRQKYIVDMKLSKIALIVSELGEAVESLRKPTQDEHCLGFSSEVVEMADALIRILDYCAAFGLPIGEAVRAKSEYNKSRPFKHGKAA